MGLWETIALPKAEGTRTLPVMIPRVPPLLLGEGAREEAWRLAEELLAASPAGHPDFLELSPRGANIGIDQVREAAAWARYPPVKAPVRVILIGPAERLSREGASALLKALEEVPAYLTYVLYAAAPDLILPTIRSRCALRWSSGARARWATELAQVHSPEDVEFLLQFVRSWADVEAVKEVGAPRESWRRALAEAGELTLPELGTAFPKFARHPLRRRALAREILSRLPQASADEALAAAEELARGGRETAQIFLEEFLQALLSSPHASPGWLRKVSLSRGELEANVNVKLLLEVILLWPKSD